MHTRFYTLILGKRQMFIPILEWLWEEIEILGFESLWKNITDCEKGQGKAASVVCCISRFLVSSIKYQLTETNSCRQKQNKTASWPLDLRLNTFSPYNFALTRWLKDFQMGPCLSVQEVMFSLKLSNKSVCFPFQRYPSLRKYILYVFSKLIYL